MLTIYIDFEGAKNIYVLLVLIWGSGRCWRFLTGVWHLHLDLDIITGLYFIHDPNFGSLYRFWRFKEHPGPLSPDFGFGKMLEAPDWGFASWYWFGYDHWFSVRILGLYLNFQGAKTSMPFKSWFGVLEIPDWVLDLDLDMNRVIGLWYTHVLNFISLSWFWRCREHPFPLSPDLGLWRMLEVPDWGWAS